MEGSILREISEKLIVIGQGHQGRVIIVPPRGKKVPKGVDILQTDALGSASMHTHDRSHCQ